MVDSRTSQVPTRGALSLTGLEHMSDTEKASRIKEVADDIIASIIYVAKQSEAGNLTSSHMAPIHYIIDQICGIVEGQTQRLIRELEKQDRIIEKMKRQHRRDIEELMRCAKTQFSQMRETTSKLEQTVERLMDKELGTVATGVESVQVDALGDNIHPNQC